MIIRTGRIGTPIGGIRYALRDGALCGLSFEDGRDPLERGLRRRFPDARMVEEGTGDVAARLEEYFSGRLEAIDALRVDTGGTAFQQRVWSRLREVAAGTTISYAQLARDIGRPGAVRAVGAANGSNPVAIVIPCHRVIGSDGRLCGYGGGIDRKRWLLAHEGVFDPALPLRAAEAGGGLP